MDCAHPNPRRALAGESGAWRLVRAVGVCAVLEMANDVLDVALDVREFVTNVVEETVSGAMAALMTTGVLGHRDRTL